jgi:hypothetical protein
LIDFGFFKCLVKNRFSSNSRFNIFNLVPRVFIPAPPLRGARIKTLGTRLQHLLEVKLNSLVLLPKPPSAISFGYSKFLAQEAKKQD